MRIGAVRPDDFERNMERINRKFETVRSFVPRPEVTSKGSKIGIIEMPEVCANCAFGGPDLRTLFLTASTSVYTLRVKTPGMPHPWYKLRA